MDSRNKMENDIRSFEKFRIDVEMTDFSLNLFVII